MGSSGEKHRDASPTRVKENKSADIQEAQQEWVLEGRELAGPVLQYLTEDLFGWIKKLKGDVANNATGKCMLAIEWFTFLNRPDVMRLDLKALAEKEGIAAMFDLKKIGTVPLCAFSDDPFSLLPDRPEITKRLQLFGLNFRIVQPTEEARTAPFEENMSARILNLIEKGTSNLFPVRSLSGEFLPTDLGNPDYVIRLYNLLYPAHVTDTPERLQSTETRLKKLREEIARHEQFLELSKHGRAAGHTLWGF